MRQLLFFLTLISALSTYAGSINPAEKILLVTIDETGTIKVNNETVGSDYLANYIQERLFKSYLGTGEMHSKIRLTKLSENVPDIVTEVVVKEIKEGLHKALTSVCLTRYKTISRFISDRLSINFYA